MNRFRSLGTGLVLAFAVAVTGCGEAPTSPSLELPEASEGLVDLLGGGNDVMVVERLSPLAADVVVSKTITPDGGIIRLPEAGFTLFFPPNAVAQNTVITVTAPAGNLVGYHFAPHGLQFGRSVIALQNMNLTELDLGNLVGPAPFAAYFQGPLQPTVEALEVLDLRLFSLLGFAAFEIEHFSGYVIATD